MALRFLQSFDYLTDLNAFFVTGSSMTVDTSGTKSRTGPNALSLAFGAGGYPTYNLASNEPKLTSGCGMMFLLGPPTVSQLFFMDSGNLQVGIGMNPLTNAYRLFLPGGGTIDLPSYASFGVYDYVELSVTFATVGSIWVKVNGFTTYQNNAINTKSTGNSYANQVCVTGPGGGGRLYIDDWYCTDGNSAFNTSFLGPIRVYPVQPTSDTATIQWTPSTVGTHWNKVNNLNSGFASNVSDAVIGDIDQYNYVSTGVIPAGGIIQGMQLNLYAALDTPGARQIACNASRGASNVVGPNFVLSTGRKYFQTTYDRDPISGGPLSYASIDTTAFGPKVIA